MRVVISGIASATPPGVATQEQALDLMVAAAGLTGDKLRFARAIFERSGIHRRASVLCDRGGVQSFYPPAGGPPGTAARMELYARHAPPLAARACAEALSLANVPAGAVTHLVTASCTGFGAPGVDIELIDRLGLRPDVRRIHVGFMGCHAAINALAAASAIVRAHRDRDVPVRVLIACVELSSIHLQPSDRPDHIVAGALFGDGAGACVLCGEPDAGGASAGPSLELLDTGSMLVPDSRDAMGWSIGDHGFAMTLAEGVPGLVREHLRAWLDPWLERTLGSAPNLRHLDWCVHPGGPRILEAVRDALDLDPASLRFSREVLRDHGNMSSATILFILERMLRDHSSVAAPVGGGGGGRDHRRPVVMLAFGPGLSLEAALARPC